MPDLAARLPRLIGATLVAVAMATPVLADTTINGGDVGGQTWTPAGSPYLIKGDITVAAGTTLRMLPNTQVRVFAGDLQAAGIDPTAVEITVRGELIAEHVTIDANAVSGPCCITYDRWYGIVIESAATLVRITDSILNAGVASITYRHPGSILDVAGTRIFNSSGTAGLLGAQPRGVGMRIESGAPLIERVEFSVNEGGVVVTGSGRPFIRSSRFEQSGEFDHQSVPNIAIDIRETDATATMARIFNNTFVRSRTGVPSINVNPAVAGLSVEIVNNEFEKPNSNGMAITAGPTPATVSIHHNMFEDLAYAASGVALGAANFQGTGSAAIDSGTNAVDVPTDLLGNPRPRRFITDVGAYENPGAVARGDVDNDLKADLFWREAAPGAGLSWWTMNGAAITGTNYLEAPAGWQVIDVGDFDGDGKSDLLWRRPTDGANSIWTLDGLAPSGFFDLGIVGPTWTLLGAGDLDGDGKSDLVWLSPTGPLWGWRMNGGTIASQGQLGSYPIPPHWHVDIADMNGDGKVDIVFWDTMTGAVRIWFMNGLTTTSEGNVAPLDPAQWSLVAVADFNGDGKGDFLWRNTSGDTWVWLMNGATFVSGASLGNPGPGWSVRSAADFDGDGKADLVWRHTDGTTYFWKMNGASISSTMPIANPGGSWQVVAP